MKITWTNKIKDLELKQELKNKIIKRVKRDIIAIYGEEELEIAQYQSVDITIDLFISPYGTTLAFVCYDYNSDSEGLQNVFSMDYNQELHLTHSWD